ncbi:hypothetical protein VNO80_19827 [Phaseolus coccineus]|uniref:Uncharacterized protein n=1 Tax=Phaseolus coccineus TaxID=3886 RepID=A0AAN9MLY6_PHACN
MLSRSVGILVPGSSRYGIYVGSRRGVGKGVPYYVVYLSSSDSSGDFRNTIVSSRISHGVDNKGTFEIEDEGPKAEFVVKGKEMMDDHVREYFLKY